MKDAMLVVMMASLANFFAGSIMGPADELEQAKGFVGYNRELPYYIMFRILYNIHFKIRCAISSVLTQVFIIEMFYSDCAAAKLVFFVYSN